MNKAAKQMQHEEGVLHANEFHSPTENKGTLIGSMVHDYIIQPSTWEVLTYFNLIAVYICLLLFVANQSFTIWHVLIYGGGVYLGKSVRNAWKEKERREAAHRIPFFADAVANALAVGATLEQAFRQSIYYLRGSIKGAFEELIAKNVLGKDLGVLLRDLNERYPKTGLSYFTSLLEEYRELGIGISPQLKQLAEALQVKEGAEEKIRAILSGGSNYARLSILVFGISFFAFSFLLKDQVPLLLTPTLKPVLMFFIGWGCLGIVIVTRITSLEFSCHYALRPYVKPFMAKKQWTIDELFHYSGMEYTDSLRRIITYTPLLVGFIVAFLVSEYHSNIVMILIGYGLGIMMTRMFFEFWLKGVVEDQLIKAVETFPDFLQVFIIGLNSGLNTFKAFEFAEQAVHGMAPVLVSRELFRTKCALECGEEHAKAWQRLAERLPFEAIIDFCETMVISPLHGESIVKSINQMMTSYEAKKLNLIEKKATSLGQMVIPIIVLAFFPIFLFAVFGPLFVQVSELFAR